MIFINFLIREQQFKNANEDPGRPNFIHSSWTDDTMVFLSTSHSARHIRDGFVKSEKGETIVVMLAEDVQQAINLKYGNHTVGTMYKTNNPLDDPNYCEESEYRDFFIKNTLLKRGIVFDFHIMASKRPHDIDVGTNYFKNIGGNAELAQKVENHFKANGLDARTDFMFKADPDFGFSRKVHEANPQLLAFQFELNFRQFLSNERYVNLVYTFVTLVELLIADLELIADDKIQS